MLLGLYIGTTIYVWRTMIKYADEFMKRLNDEGLELIKKETSLLTKILIIIALSFPVLNLVFAYLFGDINKSYEKTKNTIIENGGIKVKENVNIETMDSVEYIKSLDKSHEISDDIYLDQIYDGEEDIYNTPDELKQAINKANEMINSGKYGNKISQKELIKILKKVSKSVRKLEVKNKKNNIKLTNQLSEPQLYPLMEQHYDGSSDNYSYKKANRYR